MLIDSFGGNPADSSKSTLKAGTDKRMIHFAFLLHWDENPAWSTNPAGYNEALLYDPLGIETQTKDKGFYQFNPLGINDGPWQQFLNFYRNGYGSDKAVNTGDWAVTDIDDTSAAELFKQITGNYPEGYTPGSEGCDEPMNTLLPNLPQGFHAMEHFNFPTIVHKLDKPIFETAQLPVADSAVFHTFPWYNDLTKPAEANNTDAVTPHWPTYPSGITLGRGFDLSKFSDNKDVIKKALQRVGIDNKLITDAVGLSPSAAQQYWSANKKELQKIQLTAEQQYLLSLYAFEAKGTNMHSVPGASSGVIKLYNKHVKGTDGPAWKELDSKIRDVLFDLNYRGDFHDVSGNTTENASTPFDDVAFAQSFRDAVQANSVGDFCRVMEVKNWTNEGNLWNVPPDRYGKRADHLKVNGRCQP